MSTPVTVLDSPHHGGLGVTRSLGRLGIPVRNLDASRWTPALSSRYCSGRIVWDLERSAPEESVQCLLRAGRKLGRRSILIPTTDRAALLVDAFAAALEEWYIFQRQKPGLTRCLSDKSKMYSCAQKCGVLVPCTIAVQHREDLFEAPDRLGFPIMIKNVNRTAGAGYTKTKVIVRDREQLCAVYDSIDDHGVQGFIVQEYIPGHEDTVWMFNGYFNAESECLVGFTGRKIRQCPAYTGVSSLALAEDNPDIQRIARKFLTQIGYQGIVDIDFRYDARDGRYKILDVNPRIGSTFRLFVSEDGLDVARALYLDLTGQPVPAGAVAVGRKWIVEDMDLVAALSYCKEGALSIRDWFQSLRQISEWSFFAADDMLPIVLMLRADLFEFFRRRARSIRGSREPTRSHAQVFHPSEAQI